MKIRIKSFALAFGIVYAGAFFMLTWWLIVRGYYVGEETFIGAVYPFYTVSPQGSIIGAVYAFFDGAIGGALIAWVYNLIESSRKG